MDKVSNLKYLDLDNMEKIQMNQDRKLIVNLEINILSMLSFSILVKGDLRIREIVHTLIMEVQMLL